MCDFNWILIYTTLLDYFVCDFNCDSHFLYTSLFFFKRVPNQNMPPKNKAATRSAKKGKAVRKTVSPVVTSDHESDWTSGEDEPSMKEMFSNLTAI